MVLWAFAFLGGLSAFAAGTVVEWEFPRLGTCHEGLAFSDGVTGVLVWGGGDEIRLTVGRADLWDHRGGYDWTVGQSYTNIVDAVQSGDTNRLYGLFRKVVPDNLPRNPYMLPLGRVVIRVPGAELKHGELDPFTGLGKLVLADGRTIELAMSKKDRVFALNGLPENATAATVPATDHKVWDDWFAKKGFRKAVRHDAPDGVRGGFDWELPADKPVSLSWEKTAGLLRVATQRAKTGAECRTPRATFGEIKAASVAQWKAFWEKGARVKVPDAAIQRIFDYGMYRFGAMTDPDGVPAGLQGPWLEDDKLVPWNGDYHFNINVQECYAPAFRGGHFANLMPMFRMVLGWRPLLRENARKFAQIDDGYVLPHSVDDRGVCIGGFWTGTIDHASTAWIASLMFRYVRYSGDVAFLKDGAYDFMKGAMNVYRAMMEEREGRLSLPLGPSPEWCGDNVKKAVGRDPSFQLAAAHRLCRDLIDAAKLLGEKPDPMWADVEKRLPPYSLGPGGIQLFEGQPFVESHRHHSHLAGLYPFDIIDFSDPKVRHIVYTSYDTWISRGTGYWTGWCVPWAAILNLHLGFPDAAVHLLHSWETFYCDEGHGSHHNAVRCGFGSWADGLGVMQMDGHCAAVTAILEMMAHDVNGKTEFFRGCPDSWKDVSFENVRLSDGRTVSGRRLNGDVKVSTTAD